MSQLRWLQIYGLITCLLPVGAGASDPRTVFERSLPRHSEAIQIRADQALEHTFVFQGLSDSPYIDVAEVYDWNHKGPKNDKEWAWFLNRHRYFEDLYIAYLKTGDAKYTGQIFYILEDWLAEHAGPPSGMSFSSAWRPLEAARRVLESWDILLVQLWSAPQFTDTLKASFIRSLDHHGDYLQNHHALYGNHLITEMIALLKVSLLRPQAVNSEAWRQYALDKLRSEYDKQVYPEGAHKELSSHYQRVVVRNYEKLLSLLQVSEQTELLEEWEPKVYRLWEYFASIRKPSGLAPLNNDSDREHVSHLLKQYGRSIEPSKTSIYHPNAGQVVFRSKPAKGRSPLWCFFDIGPRGSDHQHEDFMHLSLSFGNFPLLVDNGRYTYRPGAWRDYFQGPRSHNLLLIDGRDSDPMPKVADGPLPGTGFYQSEGIEAAWGEAHFSSPHGGRDATWQRVVIHLPKGHLLVLDHVLTFRPRQIEGFWHSAPDIDWSIASTSIYASRKSKKSRITYLSSEGNNLTLVQKKGEKEPTVSGWHSPRFNDRKPADSLYYSTTISQPTAFAWLFSNTDQTAKLQSLEIRSNTFRLAYSVNTVSFELIGKLPNNADKLTLKLVEKD
ncbi:MAG: alginate lyase family protein [Verrucomicrobiota bacterium]